MKCHNGYVTRIFSLFLCCNMAFAPMLSYGALPSPTDRWKGANTSYIQGVVNQALGLDINNELPKLGAQGIKSGTANLKLSADGKSLIIDQSSAKILGYWDSFNIGKENTVQFNQPGIDALAVNLINQGSPTKIYGQLNANGILYLVNPNGVFFGQGSQTDVHGLIAASLELNGFKVDGTPTQADLDRFQNESLLSLIDQGEALLVDAQDFIDGTQDLPRVIVDRGASIRLGSSSSVLAGPEVINLGNIQSDGGQVTLAGTRDDLYLAVSSNLDPDYRGFLVEVDSGPGPERGAVVNAGAITATLGNVTLVASEIVQGGSVTATTAVDVNGSIRLLARDRARVVDIDALSPEERRAIYLDNVVVPDELPQSDKTAIGTEAGSVTFLENSRTQVLPQITEEQPGVELLVDDGLLQRPSRINVEGRYLTLENNSTVLAPSGEVSFRAKVDPTQPSFLNEAGSDASIVLGDNVVIDVAGLDTAVLGADRNVLVIPVTSTEVRDNPFQKGGELLINNAEKEVYVDVRRGTALFDWKSSLGNVGKGIEERLSAGGTIDLTSTGEVRLGENVTLDVSGGKVSYEAGFIETSRILTRGIVKDISEAKADDPVERLFSPVPEDQGREIESGKWGVRNGFSTDYLYSRYFVDAYEQGFDAGSLRIRAPQQTIPGTTRMLANVTVGRFQRENLELPNGGDIILDLQGTSTVATRVNLLSIEYDPDDLVRNELSLYADMLQRSGAGSITVKTLGLVELADGQALTLQSTDLGLEGSGINVSGSIRTVGGDVDLTATGNTRNGQLGLLEVTGTIDTSGNWVNDSFVSTNLQGLTPTLDAGSISLNPALDLRVTDSALLRANAGVWLDRNGDVSIGNAGNVRVGSSQDTNKGSFEFAARVEAIGGTAGGTLSLEGANVNFVGEQTTVLGQDLTIGNDFFESDRVEVGGYSFSALDGNVSVAPTANIDLTHDSFMLKGRAATINSGDDASLALDRIRLPDYLASPGSLTLEAKRLLATDPASGIVTVESGAFISGPAQSSLALNAQNRIHFNGAFHSAGGSFSAKLSQVSGGAENSSPLNYILIGEAADLQLNAAAFDIPTPNSPLELSRIVAGGIVDLEAVYGYVLVDESANISLRGGLFDQVVNGIDADGEPALIPIARPTAAGRFSLQAESGFVMAAQVDFGASNGGFPGGELSLTLDAEARNKDAASVLPDLTIVLGDDPQISVIQNSFTNGDILPGSLLGKGLIASQALTSDNLGQVSLRATNTVPVVVAPVSQGSLLLVDDAQITAKAGIEINTPFYNVDDYELVLEAPHVQMGVTDRDIRRKTAPVGSTGIGRLIVRADLIDFYGSLAMSGDAAIELYADQGVRFRSDTDSNGGNLIIDPSTIVFNGDLLVEAPKLWVSTLADVTLRTRGDISLNQSGNNLETPIAFAGQLALEAENIFVDTEINASGGAISLTANDTLTLGNNSRLSVAGADYIPFGRLQGDREQASGFWVYPLGITGAPVRFDSLPEKAIKLGGASIVAAPGSQQDLSGGSLVYGREFIAGLGGSEDQLANQDFGERFALVPNYQAGFAPFDEIEFQGSNIPWGAQFEVAGSSLVADGRYTVLPANYALLPGAVIVSASDAGFVEQGFQDSSNSGAELASGRFLFADATGSEPWQAFVVQPNSFVNQLGSYRIRSADDFFAGGQPGSLPGDNGRLVLSAQNLLDFQGQVVADLQSSVSSRLDIKSTNDIVVGGTAAANQLFVDPALFDRIGANSILVGGERSWGEGQWEVSTTTQNIVINNSTLDVGELLLTAGQAIELNQSQINASGAAPFAGDQWLPDPGAVTVLASNSTDSRLNIEDLQSVSGDILIDSSSSITTSGALGLVYNGTNSLDGINVLSGRFELAANNISIGNGGSTVSSALLGNTDNVSLVAFNALSFIDDLNLNLDNLLLQASAIEVLVNKSVNINANELVELKGASSQAVLASTSGSSFTIKATDLFVSGKAESQRYLGIAAERISLETNNSLMFADELGLSVAGDLTLSAPAIAARSAADISVDIAGDLQLLGGQQNSFEFDRLWAGNTLAFAADSIVLDTRIINLSGLTSLETKTGGINLGANAVLDVSPYKLDTPEGTEVGPSGAIVMQSAQSLLLGNPLSLVFNSLNKVNENGQLILKAVGDLQLGSTAYSFQAGDWGQGIDTVIEAGRFSDSRQLDILQAMNNQGFNGDFNLLITGTNEDLTIGAGSRWQARNLLMAAVDGHLQVAGELLITNADKDAVLYGGKSVALLTGADITLFAEPGVSVDLSLQAPTGFVTKAAGARLTIDGGLEVIKEENDLLTDVQFVSADSLNAAELYLARGVQTSTVNASFINTQVNGLLGSVNAANPAAFLGGLADVGIAAADVKPLLDVYSAGNLTLTGATIDLLSHRTNLDLPGRLQLRAAGDVIVDAELSDGVNFAGAFFLPSDIPILDDSDSWDFMLAAGTQANYALGVADFRNNGSIEIRNNAFIRTGTGNISLFASGDIEQLGNAYVAAVGKAVYAPEPFAFFSDPNGQPLTSLPGWNGRSYLDIFPYLPGLSGFSQDGGDIRMQAFGDISSTGSEQSWASFMFRMTNDDTDPVSLSGFDLRGIRTWGAAIGEINGGVHALGGGLIDIQSMGDVRNIGFSTPGMGEGSTNDKAVMRTPGGKLSVSSFGDMLGNSFQNDGAAINLRAFGAITNDTNTGQSAFFAGSDTLISAVAGGDILFDTVVNTFTVPLNTQQSPPFFPATSESDIGSYFFDGYHTTELSLLAVGGDVVYTADEAAVLSVLGSNLPLNNPPGVIENRFSILPGQVEMRSLLGDILFNNSLTVFPSANSTFSLIAGQSISVDPQALVGNYYFYLPDFAVSDLPNIDSVTDAINETAVTSIMQPNALLPTERHTDILLARDGVSNPARVYALGGGIGDNKNQLNFDLPLAVDAYAGGDIRNASFKIQHSQAGEISRIRAEGDIIFDTLLNNSGSAVQSGQSQFFEVAGPGDLWVQAGGSIDLGASEGIYSIGNLENPLLDDTGASLHVYAGFQEPGNLQTLVGVGGDLPDNGATIIEWFRVLAADYENVEDLSDISIEAIQRATGQEYSDLASALVDFSSLSAELQQRVATSAVAGIAIADPSALVANGDKLFRLLDIGEVGFASQQERSDTFQTYWNLVGGLIALDYLQSPNRVDQLLQLPSLVTGFQAAGSLQAIASLSASDQITHAAAVFSQLDSKTQLLVAEQVMNVHTAQAVVDGAKALNQVVFFERAYVSQRQFFGEGYDYALKQSLAKSNAIQAGQVGAVDANKFNLGEVDKRQLINFQEVLDIWAQDSGTDFSFVADVESRGSIGMVFSGVRTLGGGDVNTYAPAGAIDVGLAASQLDNLGLSKTPDTLGLLAFGVGNVNAIVAGDFNVNESRVAPLAGGDLTIMSAFGDIDAGRGANTAQSTPPTQFVINSDNGNISPLRPTPVSGSGIRTSASRNPSGAELKPEERFYAVAEGAGDIFLAPPLGIIDAGEAGIRSRGNLFLGAQDVVGPTPTADGESIGVPVASTVGADIAGVGNSAAGATESAQESAAASASAAAQQANAFVTVELLAAASDEDENE